MRVPAWKLLLVLLGVTVVPLTATAQEPLTPVLGITPETLDFGCVTGCAQMDLFIFNDVNDPNSILSVSAIDIQDQLADQMPTPTDGGPFTIIGPFPPFLIPGDGTQQGVTIEFCGNSGLANAIFTAIADDIVPNMASANLTAFGNQAPNCDAGGPYPGVQGMPVEFDALLSSDPDGSIVSWDWEFGDGTSDSGEIVSHTYADPGSFTVTLTITDDCGATSECTTSAEIEPAQGNVNPVCDNGGPYAGNPGDTINFDGSGSFDPDGTVTAWDWQFGDGGTDSGEMVSHIYNGSGVFVVTLTVTDNEGASSDCVTEAVINTPPICDTGGPYAGNVGEAINFDGSGSSDPDGTIVDYTWDFGDGNSDSGQMVSHTYAAGGVYILLLTVTDDLGSTSSCETNVDVNEFPICDVGNNGMYAGAIGEEIQFDGSGSSDPDGTIVDYAWDFGDGNTGSGPMPTHAYDVMGDYTVTLCVTDDDDAESCCSGVVSVIQPTPVVMSRADATSHDGLVTITWSTSLETNNLGFHILRAEVGRAAYRVTSAMIETRADREYEFVDNTGTPGQDYDYFIEDVDTRGGREIHGPFRVTVARVLPKQVQLHPNHPNPFNPATTIAFDVPVAGVANLMIYNAAGRPVRNLVDGHVEADTHSFQWDGLDNAGRAMPSGVYFAQLRAGGVTMTRKMVMAR